MANKRNEARRATGGGEVKVEDSKHEGLFHSVGFAGPKDVAILQEVMEIEEIYMNSDSMEQLVFYLYHAKVKDARMINADLLMAADKYMVYGLLSMCVEYLKFNLSLENVLDVLVKAELTNQKSLFDSASRFIHKKLKKSSAYNEMFEKDPKLIARVLSNMLDVE